MKKIATIVLVISFLCNGSIIAQDGKKVAILFGLNYGHNALKIGHDYTLANGKHLKIQTLRFYISGIEVYAGDNLLWSEQNSYHLIDIAKPESQQIALNISDKKSNFDNIKFNLGIDSTTNVSGAMGGDLDPTNGMYWTWQSGYINFKLEGTSNACDTRNNEFQFHLGGYSSPNTSMKTIRLQTPNSKSIVIQIDIEKFISSIDLTKQNSIMIPGAGAVELSEKIAKAFSSKQ